MENHEVVVTQQAGSIQCDFKAAREYLTSRLQQYKGILFTEESKADARSTVAALRKEKKAFSDRVKEVKKEYMAPFETFASQAESLIEMYDEPINFINAQVADFERKRIDEKKKLINTFYDTWLADMKDFLPLQKIYNPKWENATTSAKAIQDEMVARKEETKKAIAAIKEMHSDVEDIALDMYKDTYDLTRCIMYITNHEQQKAAILAREQERIRQEEQERIRQEEREKVEMEHRAQEALRQAQIQAEEEKREALEAAEEEKRAAILQAREEAAQEVIDGLIPDIKGETMLYEYRMALTPDAKEKLEMYLNSVGIEWEFVQ